MKTTNKHKTKPAKTNTWFKLPCIPSGQETNGLFHSTQGPQRAWEM